MSRGLLAAVRHVASLPTGAYRHLNSPTLGRWDASLATPIPLRTFLINAFDALQHHDAQGTLDRCLDRAFRGAPDAAFSGMTLITAESAPRLAWMLLCILSRVGVMPGVKALVLTDGQASCDLGLGLLGTTIPTSSFRAGYLQDSDWSDISDHVRLLRHADVFVLTPGSDSRTTFTTRVEEALGNGAPHVLIIDRPRRCFTSPCAEAESTQLGVPTSILALAQAVPMHVIVLDEPNAGEVPWNGPPVGSSG